MKITNINCSYPILKNNQINNKRQTTSSNCNQNNSQQIKRNNYTIISNPISFGNLVEPYDQAMLVIIDGFGLSDKQDGNPLKVAKTPYLDSLTNNQNGYTLFTPIGAAGHYVGLDDDEPGNSEVGHNSIGTGRKVEQAMTRIDRAIDNGSFLENQNIMNAINHAKENNSTLHIMGSLGYSHTHTKFEHYEEMIKMAKANGVKDLAVHIFTNGEGPTQTSSIEYIDNLNKVLKEYDYPPVSTIIGRNIVMDKSGKWDRIERAYDALTTGENAYVIDDTKKALNDFFGLGVQGVEILPIIRENSKRINDNDAVIFANYRADRAVEITSALTQKNTMAEFVKDKPQPKNLYFVCMTRYADDFDLPVAFDNPIQEDTLLEILSNKGLKISTVAQQEKSAHVGFFFNGSRMLNLDNVDVHVIPANSDTTNIELNLPQVAKQVMKDIDSNDKNLIVVNFANSDIIGHKGNYDLAVKGLENIDSHLEECVEDALKNDMAVIITADHGNIEEPSHTKHTKNKVPCYVILPKHKSNINKMHNITLNEDTENALRDIAPTILDILGLDKSEKMTGKSLVIEG